VPFTYRVILKCRHSRQLHEISRRKKSYSYKIARGHQKSQHSCFYALQALKRTVWPNMAPALAIFKRPASLY
jgi:hypothetical protein